jgi:chemosensory pili system protein ChpE
MFDVFLLALWIGLVFNAAPGGVFSESLRRGVRGGFRPAFAVQVGSLVGDATWAVLGLAGVGALLSVPHLRVPLTAGGCVLLALLGLVGLRDAMMSGRRCSTEADPSHSAAAGRREERPERAALAVGVGMSLGNPWNVLYWSGVASAVSAAIGQRADFAALATFFGGFMTTSLAWCFVSAGAIALLRRALPPGAVRVVEAVCGASLLVFAALLAARTFSGGM